MNLLHAAGRCCTCVDLVIADPSLIWSDKGPKEWQTGPDGRTHWAFSSGWDRGACGVRVLRKS